MIVLSTDTEVDRGYYPSLQPHVARAYHLSYDEDERVTVAEEGYFWKEAASSTLATRRPDDGTGYSNTELATNEHI